MAPVRGWAGNPLGMGLGYERQWETGCYLALSSAPAFPSLCPSMSGKRLTRTLLLLQFPDEQESSAARPP